MPKCLRCSQTKPVKLFTNEKGQQLKTCNPCRVLERARIKAFAQKHRKKVAKWNDNYRKGATRERYLALTKAAVKRRKQEAPEIFKAYAKRWRAKYPAERRHYSAARRARRLRATPAWADQKALRKVYQKAEQHRKLTGHEVHVDHIVPLKHALVCGLHVPDNLQIVMGKFNLKKGNLSWPGMPVSEDETRQVTDLSTTMAVCHQKPKP